MTSSKRPTDDPDQLPSRRARRAAARAQSSGRDPRLATARTAARTPWYKEPMVWLTGAALAVGVIVILFASGAIGGTTKPTSRIIPPSTTKPAGLVDPANGRALGDPDAPIHVDVWADFQCPGCALYATEIEPTIVAEYVEPGKVHLEFHDYAFLDSRVTTKESQDAAAAARCAGDQGKFWDYHDWLFANQRGENRGAFSRDRLRSIAESIGLDAGAWQSCLEAGDAHAAVTAQTQQGIDAGIGQTPSLVINGTNEQALTLDQLRAKLDAILSGATPSPAATGSPAASPAATPSPTPAP